MAGLSGMDMGYFLKHGAQWYHNEARTSHQHMVASRLNAEFEKSYTRFLPTLLTREWNPMTEGGPFVGALGTKTWREKKAV